VIVGVHSGDIISQTRDIE